MERDRFYQLMRNKIVENTSIIVGGLLGLIFAVLILILGVPRALLIAFFTLLGGVIGSRESLQRDFQELLERLLPGKFS